LCEERRRMMGYGGGQNQCARFHSRGRDIQDRGLDGRKAETLESGILK
jgi:hypothetical protein